MVLSRIFLEREEGEAFGVEYILLGREGVALLQHRAHHPVLLALKRTTVTAANVRVWVLEKKMLDIH